MYVHHLSSVLSCVGDEQAHQHVKQHSRQPSSGGQQAVGGMLLHAHAQQPTHRVHGPLATRKTSISSAGGGGSGRQVVVGGGVADGLGQGVKVFAW